MNTEAKTLHIRKGTALDAVNIYRLVVDEEKRSNPALVDTDPAARIMDVLRAIDTGYVSVAVISGRIVGTIGALPEQGRPALIGAWFAVSPSFYDTPVAETLLRGLLKMARESDAPVYFALPVAASVPLYQEALVSGGFEVKTIVWEQSIERAGTGDSGRDIVAGAAGAGAVDAAPDADAAQPPARRARAKSARKAA